MKFLNDKADPLIDDAKIAWKMLSKQIYRYTKTSLYTSKSA